MKIEISNLSFSYGENEVLRNVNFKFDSSDFVCVIGPNGGGKSTLMKLILGLLKPDKGSVKIDGEAPQKGRLALGYVPQDVALNPAFPLSVLEVALMGTLDGGAFGFYKKAQKSLAREMLAKVGMEGFASRKINALSGGQRQRVYIARALASGAKTLVLDEPTASIDPRGAAEIFALLKSLNSAGVGVIMVSHDVNMALAFASRVVYVSGELVEHTGLKGRVSGGEIEHLAHCGTHFCAVELAQLLGADGAHLEHVCANCGRDARECESKIFGSNLNPPVSAKTQFKFERSAR